MVAGSGKIQGSVMGKGRSGATVRVRVKPVNPRTNKQIAQRSKFSTRTAAWRSLTAAQQLAWNAAADSGAFPLKNTLGITFQPTGAQLYNQLNLNIVKVGGTVITDPPQKAEIPAILLGALTPSAGGPEINQAYTGTLGTDHSLAIFATAQLSPGISRPGKSKFRFITAATGASPIEFYSAYESIFGSLTLGQKIFVYAETVAELTGATAQAGSSVGVVGA